MAANFKTCDKHGTDYEHCSIRVVYWTPNLNLIGRVENVGEMVQVNTNGNHRLIRPEHIIEQLPCSRL